MHIFVLKIEYLYIMSKIIRHQAIKEAIKTHNITGQDMLLNILAEKGFELTQATLSRDIKELKIVKAPTVGGDYTYQLSDSISNLQIEEITPISSFGFVSIEFSGHLAVIKTRPGYAMAIAGEIDAKAKNTILGTVAGDDTILLIPKENINRIEVINSLKAFIPNIQQVMQ